MAKADFVVQDDNKEPLLTAANLINTENYGIYAELVKNGYITIDAKDFTVENIDQHFQWIVNILKDGIETIEVQSMMVHLIFTDGEDVEFTIFDYMFNLMFYKIVLAAGSTIDSTKIWWEEDITVKKIAKYINEQYVIPYDTIIPQIVMNQTIDTIFGKFREFQNFQEYLANTINMKDTIDLMEKYPEFYDTIHLDASGVPIEDVKEFGMKGAYTQINYIKNSNHCLRDSFRTGEAISPKQYKEVYVNIGSKPNGNGGVYPMIINSSLINGGLQHPEDVTIESSIGRIAQILSKNNVGFSGNFARLLGLSCMQTRMHTDPNYICDSQNFVEVTIDDEDFLKEFNMRYYRTQKDGIDKCLDSNKDKHLIGKKLYFRSPMTCNSFARGEGICFRCYGNLAYVNHKMNVGKLAAEAQSSRFTQKLLSAKHLLESNIEAMEWHGPMFDYFIVNYDNICLREDVDYTGYKLRLSNIDSEDEYDDADYNEYVTSFSIVTPEGDVHDIYTFESDNIYLQPDISEIAERILYASDEDVAELDLKELLKSGHQIIFKIRIKNDEIQATMNRIRNIINVKAETSKYDLHSFLRAFIETNMKGGINIPSVHFEVILANQIRDKNNILELPDWSIPDNQDYQIVTLNNSLIQSPYLMTRLQYSKLNKVLIDPTSFEVSKPSDNDVFAMVNPTKYLKMRPSIHTGERNSLLNDDDENTHKMIEPIIQFNSREEYEQWKKQEEENSV